jgi:hypothetical protein
MDMSGTTAWVTDVPICWGRGDSAREQAYSLGGGVWSVALLDIWVSLWSVGVASSSQSISFSGWGSTAVLASLGTHIGNYCGLPSDETCWYTLQQVLR